MIEQCSDLTNYCGGTFNGIRKNLDYIQGMGFDAIWISPVIANTERGYHGYWAQDLNAINENFGTEQDLIDLVNECHARDIWVMVDVVANHMGYFTNWNYSSLAPFDKEEYYNKYVDCGDFNAADPAQFEHVEICWLAGLPDLDQNHPYVKSTFLKWVKDFVQTYSFDALRIDTIPHVNRKFWSDFSREAGIFTMGEVLNFELHYIATYQGPVDGILNYALYVSLREAFLKHASMNSIEDYYNRAVSTWADISVLGNFINNHDNPRFLSASDCLTCFKSALAFTITSVGIPMVYYGDEQAFKGGQDPLNRESLWPYMNRESDIYTFLRTINNFRKESRFYEHHQIQRYSDDHVYAFSRGDTFVAFTNSQDEQTRSITYHPYSDGTILCNIFRSDDCVKVENGAFPLVMNNGEVKIYSPSASQEVNPEKAGNAESMKIAAMKATYEVTSV